LQLDCWTSRTPKKKTASFLDKGTENFAVVVYTAKWAVSTPLPPQQASKLGVPQSIDPTNRTQYASS
jgi:hypothetical protein